MVKFYFLLSTMFYREEEKETISRKEEASYFPLKTQTIRKNPKASQKGVRCENKEGA